MKRIAITFAAALSLLGAISSSAQSDPRTQRIIEEILRSSNGGEIGSSTSPAPVKATRAVPITKTEKEPKAERPAKPVKTPAQKDTAKPSAQPAPLRNDRGAGRTQPAAPAPQQVATASRPAQPDIDTVYLSTLYTTHIIFDTDISYADLSNLRDIAGKVVPESKNKLAMKARVPFSSTASVSVEEANGTFHTYILKYAQHPRFLIIDTRPGTDMWALSKLDTVKLSTLYTTHLIFASDVIYADISQPGVITGKLVDQGKNKLAAKAREPFHTTASMSVEEANGVFHTYILEYEEHPASLVKDTREENKPILGSIGGETMHGVGSGSYVRNAGSKTLDGSEYGGVSANNLKKADAPTLAEIMKKKQGLFHLSTKKYDLRITCENIYSYSDVIYFTFRLDNNSGISYEASDATFVIESNNKTKRKIVHEENVFPKNRFGSLTAAAHGSTRICYSFDKMALSSDQLFKVYLYESGGQRNLALQVSYKDINNAISPNE